MILGYCWSYFHQIFYNLCITFVLREPLMEAQLLIRCLLLFKIHLLPVTRCKITCCSLLVVKSLVAHCKICLLLVAEFACCKKSLITRCKIRSLLVAKNHSLLVVKFARCLLQKLLVAKIAHCTANFDRYLLCKVTTNKNQI